MAVRTAASRGTSVRARVNCLAVADGEVDDRFDDAVEVPRGDLDVPQRVELREDPPMPPSTSR